MQEKEWGRKGQMRGEKSEKRQKIKKREEWVKGAYCLPDRKLGS